MSVENLEYALATLEDALNDPYVLEIDRQVLKDCAEQVNIALWLLFVEALDFFYWDQLDQVDQLGLLGVSAKEFDLLKTMIDLIQKQPPSQ